MLLDELTLKQSFKITKFVLIIILVDFVIVLVLPTSDNGW